MSKQIELIRQALAAAESSIRLAKQLLGELEGGASDSSAGKSANKTLPGVMGTFDGESMVTESGEKFSVSANYASKSMLVVGDTLKLVEEKGEKRFKQIEHVKRQKTKGVLTKKDGKYHVVAAEGSYRVLPAAVAHFSANVGDELSVFLPAKNLTATWGAIESVGGEGKAAITGTRKESGTQKPRTTEVGQEIKVEEKTKTTKAQGGKETQKKPVTARGTEGMAKSTDKTEAAETRKEPEVQKKAETTGVEGGAEAPVTAKEAEKRAGTVKEMSKGTKEPAASAEPDEEELA